MFPAYDWHRYYLGGIEESKGVVCEDSAKKVFTKSPAEKKNGRGNRFFLGIGFGFGSF